MLAIRLGGTTYAHGIAPTGDLKFSTAYTRTGGGLLTVSWGMAVARGFTHPLLRRGTLVELMFGPKPLGAAILAEPDRSSGEFTADGLFRLAEDYVAVDSTGVPSTDLSIIIPEAISNPDRRLPWKDPGTLPAGALSQASQDAGNLNTLAAVLNRYCEVNGKRWRIDSSQTLRLETDPTSPLWAITPGTLAMATADDDYTSAMYGRYVSAVSGSPPEPVAWGTKIARDTKAGQRWGVREVIEDVTDLGYLSGTDAQSAVNARFAAERPRPAFSEQVEVSSFQLTTLGGTFSRSILPLVRGGQMVRQFGVLDSDGNYAIGKTLDWVVGGTTYTAGEDVIQLSPMDLAPRTYAGVVAAQQAQFKGVFA